MEQELTETTQKMLLEKMHLLPVELPPQFLELAEYAGEQRYVGVWYSATQACLADGRMMRGVSYFAVYAPLVNHPAISYYVRQAKADLGSDETFPTHCLLLDRAENKIYLGEYNRVQQLLNTQYPNTAADFEDELKRAAELMLQHNNAKTLADFQRLGMFEMFGNSPNLNSKTYKLCEEMQKFLDQFLPSELIEYYRKSDEAF